MRWTIIARPVGNPQPSCPAAIVLRTNLRCRTTVRVPADHWSCQHTARAQKTVRRNRAPLPSARSPTLLLGDQRRRQSRTSADRSDCGTTGRRLCTVTTAVPARSASPVCGCSRWPPEGDSSSTGWLAQSQFLVTLSSNGSSPQLGSSPGNPSGGSRPSYSHRSGGGPAAPTAKHHPLTVRR